MANQEHLDILRQGVEVWNKWRKEHPNIQPDLFRADLSETKLNKIDLSGAELKDANFFRADLSEADLSEAKLSGANLSEAKLSKANLSRAILRYTNLVEANLNGANLAGCSIYGASAWNVQLINTIQSSLIITLPDEPTITIDNLTIAQFIYLLLNNAEIRHIINTITTKVVLILGRFTFEQKVILDGLREELRQRDYVPVLFDFDNPESRDVTETVTTLAHMAQFIIADITDPRSVPHELALIIPALPSVPVQPIILSSQREYGMFQHFTRFPWVLPIYQYTDQMSLLQSLKEKVIDPAEQKAQELAQR